MTIGKKGLPLKVQLKDLQGSLQEHPSFIKSNTGRQLGGNYTKVWIFDQFCPVNWLKKARKLLGIC
jgi:hypothetical protein